MVFSGTLWHWFYSRNSLFHTTEDSPQLLHFLHKGYSISSKMYQCVNFPMMKLVIYFVIYLSNVWWIFWTALKTIHVTSGLVSISTTDNCFYHLQEPTARWRHRNQTTRRPHQFLLDTQFWLDRASWLPVHRTYTCHEATPLHEWKFHSAVQEVLNPTLGMLSDSRQLPLLNMPDRQTKQYTRLQMILYAQH